MFSITVSRLQNLNFFASPTTANNEYELQNERISTRIFIITLLLCIFIIFIYTGQSSITQTIDVKNPSYDQFQSLSLRYSQTLQCPCDNVAIPHSSFILLKPNFHQLCSSDFIQQDWIDYIASAGGFYVSADFTYTGDRVFLTLAAFCSRANATVMTALETFNSTRFITVQAFTKSLFEEQIQAIIESFYSSTELNYYELFNLIQFSTKTNMITSGQFSNIQLGLSSVHPGIVTTVNSYENGTCDCGKTSSCVAPLTLQDRRTSQSSPPSLFTIPGLFTGCYLVDAIRQSSLECFYQASCIAMIELYLQAPLILNETVLPLNSTADSRFNVTSTIDQLLSKAMTEQWTENVFHDQYFAQCEVSSCTYSITTKFNIIYIITTFLGLIGGLTKVLHLLIHRIVKFIRRRFVPLPLVTNELVHVSLLDRFRNFNYFLKPSPTSNEQEIKQQIISTRMFFLLLTVSFIILITYYGTERTVTIYQIESPTFEQFSNLQRDQQSNPSFSCPCSTITTMYENIIDVIYTLHPFCSSDFVQQEWLDYTVDYSDYFYYDFRVLAPVLFNSLASLCEVSIEYIHNSLTSFNASLFVVDEALSPETFMAETNTIVDTFILSTRRSFSHNLALISNMTQNNGLMSSFETNFAFIFLGTYPSYNLVFTTMMHRIPSGNTWIPCGCNAAVQCVDPISIYPGNIVNGAFYRLLNIPDLYLDCLIIEGIRDSTLLCLFNQSCVNLMSFWLNISSVNAIDVDNLIHFDTNSSLADIIDEILVDQWNHVASYRAFYEQCRPSYCTHSLNQHNSFWIILTVVLSLIGGLMKIFKVIVPYFVHGMFTLYFRCHHQTQRETVFKPIPFSFSFRSVVDRICKFNLFSSDNPTTANDEDELRGQIISTRLFLILFAISLIILSVYSSQVQITKTVTIANPSMEQYISLCNNHSSTLICPCKNIAILQKTFLNLQPNFHQVCESDFIDPRWAYGFGYIRLKEQLFFSDFRFFGSGVFGTISSLCQLSVTAISDGLLDFGESSFVTTQVISHDLLLEQGQALFDLFISTSENAFITSLETIRDTTQANSLLSGFATSMHVQAIVFNQTNVQIVTSPMRYGLSASSLCSCYIDPTCVIPASLYTLPIVTSFYSIPGFFSGCYIVEATLKSNLASLYNQTWIDEFRTAVQFDTYAPVPFNTTALNSSLDSQYNITTPISIMMENMMTEPWETYVNYSAYYEECHPIECKYTYIVKHDIVYMITTIIGVIGGLSTILQFAIPYAVKLIRQYFSNRCCHTRVQVFPIIQIPENK